MGQKKEKEETKLKRQNKWESTEKEKKTKMKMEDKEEKREGVEESGYVCGGENQVGKKIKIILESVKLMAEKIKCMGKNKITNKKQKGFGLG